MHARFKHDLNADSSTFSDRFQAQVRSVEDKLSEEHALYRRTQQRNHFHQQHVQNFRNCNLQDASTDRFHFTVITCISTQQQSFHKAKNKQIVTMTRRKAKVRRNE